MMAQDSGHIIGNRNWDGLSRPHIYYAMASILCALFLSVMDGTICNVALPTIAQQMHISSSDSIWIVNIFQLVIMMTLLPFASLGEVVGYRRVFLCGLGIFTGGSFLCAVSGGFHLLLAARLIQGIGSSMVMSINTSLVKIIYPQKDLGKGVGLNATMVALGLVAGPPVAGVVLSLASWPWLFVINIPIGIAAFAIGKKYLPENPVKIEGKRFNFREAFLNVAAFGLFIGCFEAFSHMLDSRLIALMAVLMAVAIWVYVKDQLHREYPMLPFDLLRIPIFSLSVATSIVSYASQMMAMVAIPFMTAHTFGYDAVQTGMVMTAYPLVIMVMAPTSGWLVGKVNAEVLASVGLAVMCAGCFLLACLTPDAGFWDIAWRLSVCGLGFGFFQSPNNHLLLSSAPAYRAGSAGGMLATARLVGQTLGTALVALFFNICGNGAPHQAMLFAGFATLFAIVISLRRVFLKNR